MLASFGRNLRAGLLWITVCACAGWAQKAPARSPESPPQNGIGCLGRIEPEDGVIHVTAPYVEGAPAVIERLPVRENERVLRGRTLAVLHGEELVEAAIREASARVGAAGRRVAQAQEPPKQADVEARQAAARRLEA